MSTAREIYAAWVRAFPGVHDWYKELHRPMIPSIICPFCYAEAEAHFEHNGVGYEQVTAAHCHNCDSYQDADSRDWVKVLTVKVNPRELTAAQFAEFMKDRRRPR